jgi:hypothetical protein
LTKFWLAVIVFCACAANAVPSEAATTLVPSGGDLQAALNAAQPGDTILLQAGATWTGSYKLPAKSGTAMITVRSSAPDSSLPPAGTRVTPAYSSSLAKIKAGSRGGIAITTATGASNWRLMFLEFSPESTTSSSDLVDFGVALSSQSTLAAVPQHLIMDRCYLHGDPTFGQRRGLGLNSGDTQIINSYFSDFKGALQDTQAIGGWNGPGPFLIENNYLEAAGENIMFGGSDPNIPNLVPSNITIRRNLISKPLAWMSQSWTIKNLIELKNAANVTIEGNTIENNWAAGQQGYSIVLTPRNQNNTAPWSVVKNITIQNNVIRHVAAAFNILGYDNLAPSQQTQNIKILNNLAYDVSTAYALPNHPANALFAVIGAGPKDITISHNTIDSNGHQTISFYAGTSPTGTAILGFVLENNLLRDNLYGIMGDSSSAGTASLAMYAPGAIVLGNSIGGGNPKTFPSGNDYPTLAQWLADFVSIPNADYRLVAGSASKNGATDGTDIGVNFTTLNAALAGSGGSTPPPPPPTSTPFSGTPVSLPGTVEAENYDRGGQGIAYSDTTAGNSGGAYRSDDVDIRTTTDSSGSYNLKSVRAGEWLAYSVNIASAGTYSVALRVASSGGGGTVHLTVDGVNVTGSISLPDTGGWDTWQTVTKTGVSLPAGAHVLKLIIDANGSSGTAADINWIRVSSTSTASATSTPFNGTPIAVPGTIQAENYDVGGQDVAYHDTTEGNNTGLYRSNSVDIQTTTDTGGGYKVKTAVAGEWLNYSVSAASSGTFTIGARVSSSGAGGTFHVEIDGVNRTGTLAVPNTGGWESWTTVTKSGIAVAAGRHVMRVVLDSNGSSTGMTGNFNWFSLR